MLKLTLVPLLLMGAMILSGCKPVAPPVEEPASAATAAPTAETGGDSPRAVMPTPFPIESNATNSLGDPYAPLMGNPGYDAQHYTVDIAIPTDDLKYIESTTTMEAIATADLPTFGLDFLGLDVSAVSVNGVAADFSRSGPKLTITPATPIAAGESFEVSVTYSGHPEPYNDPQWAYYGPMMTGGWREWGDGYIAALNQPSAGLTWFPSNNHPSDKATYTFRVTVDKPKMAVATGILQEVVPVDEDTNTYVWQMDKPMSTQVASVIVGEFELQEGVSPNGVKIRNYFPPGLDPAVKADYAPEKLGEVVDFLAEVFGPYPYDAYGVVAVPGWVEGSGYETQSIVTYPASHMEQALLVHEAAHQWFGDAITVKSWKDLWLHEGFATYAQKLWAEHEGGVEPYNQIMRQVIDVDLSYGTSLPAAFGLPPLPLGQVFPAVDPGVRYNYVTSYTAGELLLHNLRLEVGDETFFTIVRTFVERYSKDPGNASSEDFIAVAEEVAGRNLSTVWDTWMYGTTMPSQVKLLSGEVVDLTERLGR